MSVLCLLLRSTIDLPTTISAQDTTRVNLRQRERALRYAHRDTYLHPIVFTSLIGTSLGPLEIDAGTLTRHVTPCPPPPPPHPCPHTRTHAPCAHPHTHRRTRPAHTPTHPHTHTPTHPHTHTPTHPHTHTPTHPHTHTPTHPHTHTPTHPHTHTPTHPHTHTPTHPHTTPAHPHAHARTPTRIRARECRTQAQAHAHARSRAHAHGHTLTHSHARAQHARKESAIDTGAGVAGFLAFNIGKSEASAWQPALALLETMRTHGRGFQASERAGWMAGAWMLWDICCPKNPTVTVLGCRTSCVYLLCSSSYWPCIFNLSSCAL